MKASESNFGWEGEDLISLGECEVIGNIYENPELMEKHKLKYEEYGRA